MSHDSRSDGPSTPTAPFKKGPATQGSDAHDEDPNATVVARHAPGEVEGDEPMTVTRATPDAVLNEAAPPSRKSTGGLHQMFSRGTPVRSMLPTEDEGDALLDMLFVDPSSPRPPAAVARPAGVSAAQAAPSAPSSQPPQAVAPHEPVPSSRPPSAESPRSVAPASRRAPESARQAPPSASQPALRAVDPSSLSADVPFRRGIPVLSDEADDGEQTEIFDANIDKLVREYSLDPVVSSRPPPPAPEEPAAVDDLPPVLSPHPELAASPQADEPPLLEPLEADQSPPPSGEIDVDTDDSDVEALPAPNAAHLLEDEDDGGAAQLLAAGDAEEALASGPPGVPIESLEDRDPGADPHHAGPPPFVTGEPLVAPEVEAKTAPSRLIPVRAPVETEFPHEEDANARLLRTNQRDAWVERAEWLRAEAVSHPEPGQRGRGLLAVSELQAMTGEEGNARSTVAEARALAPWLTLAHANLRGLLARAGEWSALVDVLEAEGRLVPPAARCHGALLGAEIARICENDPETARRRMETALRAEPADPRAHVQRFCEALGAAEPAEGPAPPLPRGRFDAQPELALLEKAFARAAANRGQSAPDATPDDQPGLEALLLAARATLDAGDVEGTLEKVAQLGGAATLAGGARWLVGVLGAPAKETRARAALALRGALGGSHEALARRALAARAIELGDAESARAATDTSDELAFTATDRIALAALTGGSVADVAPWIAALGGDDELAPIAAAASAALAEPGAPGRTVQSVGTLHARLATTLGRKLAAASKRADSMGSGRAPAGPGTDDLSEAVRAYADGDPEGGVARALTLELDLEAGAGGRLARTLAALHDDADGELGRTLASALLAEAAGETERAKADYERAFELDRRSEAVVRAASAHAEPREVADLLIAHAEALAGGTRAALAFTEAAVRRADDPASGPLLRRAAELDPKLPVALFLGERAARAAGDGDGLLAWIKLRRDAADDPIEQAFDLTREALLVAPADAPAAALLLEQALRARPSDTALRELYERFSPEALEDRASWRAERAGEATGVEAGRLALEAALDLERSGDFEDAARCARQAMASGERHLAPLVAYRAALAGHGTGDLVDTLMPKARESTDALERLEIYEQLAELDERGRGDAGSALLWRRTILEEVPRHLPTLRRVATALITSGRDEELEPVALELARTLEGAESTAHAHLSARLRLRFHGWDETLEPVEIAYGNLPRGTWALRQMGAHAMASGRHALASEVDRLLIEQTERASERATLSMRAGEAAQRAEQLDDACAFFAQARDVAPGHLRAHLALAELLEQMGNHGGAAAAFESAATAALTTPERLTSLYRAAILWHDHVHDVPHARATLESVSELDPAYADVFTRLQAIYVAEGARGELADLLKRRLDAVTDPTERVEMEVLRGRALADVGDPSAAKHALAAALEANPDHVEALAAFAEVAALEQDWPDAEQAWIRLARLVPDPARQTAIYFRLGELYDQHLPNPERAELAYQEILKRSPSEIGARERLVALFQRAGDPARAIEQQTVLINEAEAPEVKCHRTTELAGIYETAGENKKAETTLLAARKTWPKDDLALGALARFYQRTGQAPAATVLLDRAVADARRALSTGRFEPYLFSTVATVAELRDRPDAAALARAAVAALEGGAAELEGAGPGAGGTEFDELLAPEVITPAFRELLGDTGPLLDAAVPYDMNSVRASPLHPSQAALGEQIRALGAAYGLSGVQVHVSAALGLVCIPATAHPPAIVLGQPLVSSQCDDVRAFLIHRALKIIQTNTAALSRTAPIDLWPLLGAYLKAFNATWAPPGIDPAKLTEFYGRISRAVPKGLDLARMGALATEVISTIGNRASTLNTVVNGWGNRAGLLAVGDLNVALTGIAWAGGYSNAPPPTGKDRTTWIGRNVEARELVVFSVSDTFADARTRLGLATEAIPIVEADG